VYHIPLCNAVDGNWSCPPRSDFPFYLNTKKTGWLQIEPGIERVQALTDISHSALCCHSNETHAPIANPPNSAQLEGTPYHSAKLHPVLCSSVECGKGQTAVTYMYFASATPHVKCNDVSFCCRHSHAELLLITTALLLPTSVSLCLIIVTSNAKCTCIIEWMTKGYALIWNRNIPTEHETSAVDIDTYVASLSCELVCFL